MKKFLAATLAAVTFGGAVAATAAPAQAREYRHYGGYDNRYYGRHRGNDTGVAIAAGVAGLALGAALASNGNGYSRGYASRGYSSGYYDGGYYDYGPRVCESRRVVWDPYIRERVVIRSHYRC